MDESAIVNLLPSGTGTFGFGSLQQRNDNLWLTDVEYVPLARKLMKEGVFRYFSPVFRGLVDAPLRVTSVALENEPAMNNLDQIAAADSCDNLTIDNLTQTLDALAASANASSNPKTENSKMNKLLTALAALLGMDAIALGADNDVPDDIVTQINNAAAELGSGKSFATGIRDSLSLAADADAGTVMAALKGLQAKGESYDGLKAKVDSLALAAETAKRDDLINLGMTDGKLSQAMVDNWINDSAKPVDSIALAAFLDNAPVVVPVDNIDQSKLPKSDTVALSAEDREVCKMTGISETDFLDSKKNQ
ncbi:MAG: phage protease [Victivallaceae bacterium]|nr:phage protease [Victivallaceae bacterium]